MLNQLVISIVILALLVDISNGYYIKNTSLKYNNMYSNNRFITNNILLSTNVNKNIDIIDKPKWAAGGIVSDIVNYLISVKPLFSVMKVLARNTLIETAEKNSIPWKLHYNNLNSDVNELETIKSTIENSNINYPSYYTQEFHAYDNGNLCWNAAMECEPATLSMALRVWPKDELTPLQAQDQLRLSFINAVKDYSNNKNFNTILDIGCSVGVSTYYLCSAYSKAKKIDALDLSPYFLAVAKARANNNKNTNLLQTFSDNDNEDIMKAYSNVNWIHANMEESGLPDNNYDFVAGSFVTHELPSDATESIFREMYRVTAPGGMVALTDNDPTSPVIQNLPPALFTLMKSTEPWSDQYYALDMKKVLESVGFSNVIIKRTDPRHRTIMASKPK